MPQLIATIILLTFVVVLLSQSIKVIRQQSVGIVERLGKFKRVLEPGPHLVVPIVDKVRYNLDMREAVRPFPPQGVITEDNLMVNIDSVIYFQIVDPVRAAYEAQNYEAAIEQLTMTTLRNIIGGLDLEETLTSREEINQKLRAVLDDATGKWGIKVNRVELRAIEPPPTIRDAMEKGARAERDKRAAVLIAEGQRQSQILSAAGEKESAVLRAQGEREAMILRAQADRQSKMLRAEGEAQAITTVFEAIHAGEPDQGLLAYQYMQMLPTLARGDSNKVWIVPSELNDALKGLGSTVGEVAKGITAQAPTKDWKKPEKVDVLAEIAAAKHEADVQANEVVKAAVEEAEMLENPNARRRNDDDRQLSVGSQPSALEAPGQAQDQGFAPQPAAQPPATGPGSQQPAGNPWQQQGNNPYGPQGNNPYAPPSE